ncbi:hypothetical protein IKQ21_03435 [bacterium]|nr:hypothetical protein [bacterium]
MINEEEKTFLKTVIDNITFMRAAKVLEISEKEVKEKLKTIYNKLGVKNIIQACLKVYKSENILKH